MSSLLSVLLPIAFTLIAIKFLSWLVHYFDFKRKLNKFPGPEPYPIIGNALEFQGPKDVLPNCMKYMKQYGLTFKLQLGLTSYLFTTDPRLNELVTTSHSLLEKSLAILFMKKWIGDGLISANVDRWKVHRKLISPTFHFKVLEDFVPVFNENAERLVEFMKRKRMGDKFDVYEDMLLCSLDAICETAMGIKINALEKGDKSDYVESIKHMGRVFITRSFSFWKQYDFLYERSSEHQKELEMIGHIKAITANAIQTRREVLAKEKKTQKEADDVGQKKKMVFLDQLLMSTKENGGVLTDEELREEVDTFIFAGHDTVASAMAFALYFLAEHQEMQQKAYNEIIEIVGPNESFSFDKLGDLRYLDAVIKETLRLCPSVPVHSRIITQDTEFDGKIIPKGVHVVLFLWGSHRNEKLFKDPEVFKPERFLDDQFAKNSLFGYLPFNAGPRNCIGQKYAMIKMKCILGLLLREFKFTKDPNFVMQPVAEGVLKSSNGLWLSITPRK